MITLRRTEDRHHDRRTRREIWHTFDPAERADPPADGFGALENLDEIRLSPGGGSPRRPHRAAEILTYVREGVLAYSDSTGCSGIVHAGEFQRTAAGCGIYRGEANASRTHRAQVFQVRLRAPEADIEPGHEQKRFSAAERRGQLRVVASPDARGGSLRIHRDALMCSALLDPGKHVVHELSPGRNAWLHLVHGEATLGDVVLTTGDGAGFTAERAVSLTAREETEVLLLDLANGRGSPGTSPIGRLLFHDGTC